jgi:aspartate-semialdehyde dehydrogenase
LIVPQVNAHEMAARPASNIIIVRIARRFRWYGRWHAARDDRHSQRGRIHLSGGVGSDCRSSTTSEDSVRSLAARPVASRFPRLLAFNVIPQIDVFCDDGFTLEERKLVLSRKILGDRPWP